MTATTAMSSAFHRAGLNVAEARLRQLAATALRSCHRNIPRALERFERDVDDDPELIREALLHYLCRLDHEMSGQGLSSSDSRTEDAEARQHQNGDAADQYGNVDRIRSVGASPGVGLVARDNHSPFAHSPSAAQRAAASAVAKTIAVTVLDTYRVRDGRAIGDVRYGELERLRAANAREASVIKLILQYAKADHDVAVRDIVKADDLARMIQQAAEIDDAA